VSARRPPCSRCNGCDPRRISRPGIGGGAESRLCGRGRCSRTCGVGVAFGPLEQRGMIVSSENEVVDAFRRVRSWTHGDRRAPHKPLLLLLALARVQRPDGRWLRFAEIEEQLRALLDAFGPPGSARNPHYPFWRLRNDGLWEVPDADLLESSQTSSGDVSLAAVRIANARGGFRAEIYDRLRSNPRLANSAATQLLADGFQPLFTSRSSRPSDFPGSSMHGGGGTRGSAMRFCESTSAAARSAGTTAGSAPWISRSRRRTSNGTRRAVPTFRTMGSHSARSTTSHWTAARCRWTIRCGSSFPSTRTGGRRRSSCFCVSRASHSAAPSAARRCPPKSSCVGTGQRYSADPRGTDPPRRPVSLSTLS
jgi:hypothetical protein